MHFCSRNSAALICASNVCFSTVNFTNFVYLIQLVALFFRPFNVAFFSRCCLTGSVYLSACLPACLSVHRIWRPYFFASYVVLTEGFRGTTGPDPLLGESVEIFGLFRITRLISPSARKSELDRNFDLSNPLNFIRLPAAACSGIINVSSSLASVRPPLFLLTYRA